MPSLQTITTLDIEACDYKKHHRDDNKYNVSHMIAPENRLVCQAGNASAMPAARLRNDWLLKRGQWPAGCNLQEMKVTPLQFAGVGSG
jgi:hypothetical protein